jgi:hypothetical protein
MNDTERADYLQQWRLEQREGQILSSDDREAHYLAAVDPIQVIRETPDGRYLGIGWRELARRRDTNQRLA